MIKIIHNSVNLNTSFFLIDKSLVFKVQIEVLYICIIAYIFAIFLTQTNISLEGVGVVDKYTTYYVEKPIYRVICLTSLLFTKHMHIPLYAQVGSKSLVMLFLHGYQNA